MVERSPWCAGRAMDSGVPLIFQKRHMLDVLSLCYVIDDLLALGIRQIKSVGGGLRGDGHRARYAAIAKPQVLPAPDSPFRVFGPDFLPRAPAFRVVIIPLLDTDYQAVRAVALIASRLDRSPATPTPRITRSVSAPVRPLAVGIRRVNPFSPHRPLS